jgi:hypothetical protein
MMAATAQTKLPSILLIDDDEHLLEVLRTALGKVIRAEETDIRTWMPASTDGTPAEEIFNTKIDDSTILVVTDYDLTTKGERGLFGLSIVGWCQSKLIPVGDFSRKPSSLPTEPNLFELRVPPDVAHAVPFIVSTFEGFKRIRDEIVANSEFQTERSPALVLARLLGRPAAQGEFALYISWLSSSNSALFGRLQATASPDITPSTSEKASLLGYVVGHILTNAILKYPGPILSDEALAAYVAIALSEIDAVTPFFESARYQGPFSGIRRYFWRDVVNSVLDDLAGEIPDQEFETVGELNRTSVEHRLGRTLGRHSCSRCQGKEGGFYCPFTRRAVCTRSDCSVAASSWIPQGAQVCRIEREFYDEWGPLLGL